jgi:transposase
MIIAGCNLHPRYQQIAFLDIESVEVEKRSLTRTGAEAGRFHGQLARPVLIGMEAVGNFQWFRGLLGRLGHEVWIGGAAEIRAIFVRQQKTDRRDAEHILRLLIEGRFLRIGTPTTEMPDHRQLLVHRNRLVQLPTRVKNELRKRPVLAVWTGMS